MMVRPRTCIMWGVVTLAVAAFAVAVMVAKPGTGISGPDGYSRPLEKQRDPVGQLPGTPRASSVSRSAADGLPAPDYGVFPEQAASRLPVETGASAEERDPAAGIFSAGTRVTGEAAVLVFECYGRAHGVGLCMDGVKHRALSGQGHIEILNHYYTGTYLQAVDDSQPIRVKGRDGRVRELPLIEYLYRLAEEPEDYPPEGLKVLYIAARTYVLSVIARGKHAGEGFDICSSGSCCQAFDEGRDLGRFPNNIAAANATSGMALYHDGQPVVAAYCGSCGGHGENNEDVWGGAALPYLRGKPDSFCSRSERFLTTVEVSAARLEGMLNASEDTRVGSLQLVELSERTPGGRVRRVRLHGSAGVKEVPGSRLASLLGLPGTRYTYHLR